MQLLNYFFFASIHQTSIYWFHVSDIGDPSAKRVLLKCMLLGGRQTVNIIIRRSDRDKCYKEK